MEDVNGKQWMARSKSMKREPQGDIGARQRKGKLQKDWCAFFCQKSEIHPPEARHKIMAWDQRHLPTVPQ